MMVLSWPKLQNSWIYIYLLLANFEECAVSDRKIYGPSTKWSVTYTTDQEDEVYKIFIISQLCLMDVGTISIFTDQLQISDTAWKQNKSTQLFS